MIYTIATVKDELTGKFYQPNFFSSALDATRMFKYQVNENKYWKANSGDYGLYELGTYDDETGELRNITPNKIASGRACVEEEA